MTPEKRSQAAVESIVAKTLGRKPGDPAATSSAAARERDPLGATVDRAKLLFGEFQRENDLLQAQLEQAQEAKARLIASQQAIEVEVDRVKRQKALLQAQVEEELRKLQGLKARLRS